ncbi:MAG: hypothetical protein GY794_04540 [bacterium]|nr:hypothetical protein [bacterium]
MKYGDQSDDQGQRALNRTMASDSDGVIGISARLITHGAKNTIRKKTRQLFPESSFFGLGNFGTDYLPASTFKMEGQGIIAIEANCVNVIIVGDVLRQVGL